MLQSIFLLRKTSLLLVLQKGLIFRCCTHLRENHNRNLNSARRTVVGHFHTNSDLCSSATSPSGGTLSARSLFRIVRDGRSASLKNAVVVVPGSNKVKVFLELGVTEHLVGVPADGMDFSRLEIVVLVQEPSARIPIDRAVSRLVNDGLPVVLAVGFQIQLPQSIRSRIKLERVVARLGNRLLDLRVLDGNRGVLDQSGIRETNLACHVFKVVPIQGSAQAFAPQDLVFLEGFGDAAIGINVREIQFAAGLEQIQTFIQNGLFVAAKINDTVTNNHVKGSWF
mmetsp:Transcript_16786/g.41961  ORF Transcript_16786/g.41961 Transcript_16786/m.41961 type:complete len:282 (-) Transcript_16786:596-1441(-)